MPRRKNSREGSWRAIRVQLEPTGAGEFVRLTLITELVKRLARPGSLLLDLGGGKGNLRKMLGEESTFRYVLVDAFPGSEGSQVAARLESLPIKGESVGVVCLSDVLEHLENDFAVVRGAFEILEKGGTLLIHVPNSERKRPRFLLETRAQAEKEDLQPFPHVRDGYSETELKALLTKAAPDATVQIFASFSRLQSWLGDLDWLLWRKRLTIVRVVPYLAVRWSNAVAQRVASDRLRRSVLSGSSGIVAIVQKTPVLDLHRGAVTWGSELPRNSAPRG